MYCHLVFLIEGSKRAEAKKEDSKKVEPKKAEAKKNAVKLQSSNCIKGCLLSLQESIVLATSVL